MPGDRIDVSGIIRRAETLIGDGEYARAIERLKEAHLAQPENVYIQAIIERAERLRRDSQTRTTELEDLGRANGAGSESHVSATVGKDPKDGPGSEAGPQADSDHSLQARVRRLTIVANNLFERGSYEPAFHSLMKAYLLDPTSPYVIACERTLLPAWELLRDRGELSAKSQTDLLQAGPSLFPKYAPGHENPARPTIPASTRVSPEPSLGKSLQDIRLELLKRQKELERKERERQVWREASKPPRAIGSSAERPTDPPGPPAGTGEQGGTEKSRRSFLSKLRGG